MQVKYPFKEADLSNKSTYTVMNALHRACKLPYHSYRFRKVDLGTIDLDIDKYYWLLETNGVRLITPVNKDINKFYDPPENWDRLNKEGATLAHVCMDYIYQGVACYGLPFYIIEEL